MERVVFWIGMSQRPSVGFRIPYMTICLFLAAKSVDLFKYTLHVSSHNCPIEIREALFKYRRIMAVDTSVDNCDDNGRTPVYVDDMSSPFGRKTYGPELS